MTRWRSIKNDMVVFFFEGVIGQQPSELIKCGYLRRTRARQLFFNAFDNSIRQHSTYRPNDSVSIDLRRGLRSISSANSRDTAGIAVIVLPMLTPKTCPTLDAGSVLTNRTRLFCAAK